MSAFELVFAVYGLLLGLAIAEVLGGFARALKLKRAAKPVRIGWLTPLLGVVVVLDLTNFWMVAWEAQPQIGANYVTLVAVLAIVGTYYLAASLIFPDEPAEWPDFDDWYDRQNRLVIAGLLAANIGSWIATIALEIVAPIPDEPVGGIGDAIEVLGGFSILILLIALLRIKSRRWNVAALVAIGLLLLVTGTAELF
ncbi:hypothetical protein [Sphingomonas sp.]|uniref:hypothetical protein n=1 Tax=Sphingomonas sp. TaxID=28214 RepID=UPI001EB45358|nr:hypothetical protein [Sphingomonas sp.]MBX3595722.1 hypothetical protein [Sphingomonas sp.]